MLTPQQLPPDVTKPLHARAKSTSWSPFSPACGAALTALLRVVQHMARAGPFNARWQAALSNAAEALSTASCVDRQLRVMRGGDGRTLLSVRICGIASTVTSQDASAEQRLSRLARSRLRASRLFGVPQRTLSKGLRWRATVPSPGHGQRMARGSAAVGRAELRQQGDSIDENS
jgi:hypothetical protein